MSTVEVDILGRKFSIRTQGRPEDVLAAAQMVQERAEELRRLGAAVASDRLLALVALNLAGELREMSLSRVRLDDDLLAKVDEVILQLKGLAEAPLR